MDPIGSSLDHAPYCDSDGWLLPMDQWPEYSSAGSDEDSASNTVDMQIASLTRYGRITEDQVLIEINSGHTIILADRIAAVHATTSGRTHSLSIHVAHSAPLHVPYGEDAERCMADMARLREALCAPHQDGGPW